MRAALPLIIAAGLVSAAPAAAQTQTGEYAECPAVASASIVSVSGVPCDQVAGVAGAVAAAPPPQEGPVLAAAGWQPVRAQTVEGGHDIVAVRGRTALRIRRSGEAPDLDGFSAGRELIFSRRTIVGGRPIPGDGALCTSSWTVRLRNGSLGGLTAAHCAGLRRRDRTAQRRNGAQRRPPQPGFVLGRVQRILTRSEPLDALVVPVPTGLTRPSVPVVDRGTTRPPWSVIGRAQARGGRAVCYSGRTSGIDQCGRIVGRAASGVERFLRRRERLRVRCTNIPARQGDSGGPVYTRPAADGSVRAVGIVTLIVGPASVMCFTPLDPVLDKLRARLVTSG